MILYLSSGIFLYRKRVVPCDAVAAEREIRRRISMQNLCKLNLHNLLSSHELVRSALGVCVNHWSSQRSLTIYITPEGALLSSF